MVRLSALPSGGRVPVAVDLDDAEAMRAHLARIAADPLLREALAVSSASLDGLLAAVAAGRDISPVRLRRAVRATAGYLSRMAHRATPFGMLAGVAAARVGDAAHVRIGPPARRVRPDMGWLSAVLAGYETRPDVLGRLTLVANDLCIVRADRLVLPFVPEEDEVPAPDDREQSVRHTAAVRAAMDAARTPVRHAALLDHLAAGFPDAPAQAITGLVGELVTRGFLLTDLRPPATAPDPLGHVLERLPPGTPLTEVRERLDAYAAAPPGAGYAAWRAAHETMRRVHATDRTVHVDLAIDADIVVPRRVVDDVARAVSLAWRLLPAASAPRDPLAAYRAEFVERYGTGTLVPIAELLDPQRGLGPPAGYLLPPGPRGTAAPAPTSDPARDQLLLGVAHRAARQRAREVVLVDELIAALAREGDDEPPYTDACFQVLADEPAALDDGRYLLVPHTSNFTRRASLFGRFLAQLPGLRSTVAELVAAADVPAVQLIGPVKRGRNLNVSQVPELTDPVVRVGVFADRPRDLGLHDLAVSAELDRFLVVRRDDGTEIAPTAFHSLSPLLASPNAVRLLAEIGEENTPTWPLWEWGAAWAVPFLPRIRHGRAVLAPARWRPDRRLAGRLDRGRWRAAFERWRVAHGVPDVVHAVDADHHVRLDLTNPVDLHVLQSDLRKRAGLVLQEEPGGGEPGNGWTGGRAAEIVVPLYAERGAATGGGVASRPRRQHVSRPVPPGGDWVSLALYGEPARHPRLLTDALPGLLAKAPESVDRWFFVRYRDPAPHLRVRVHGRCEELNAVFLPAVHEWTAGLLDAGVIGDAVLATYRPEIARYGGPHAMEAAERAFHADSEAVLELLTLRRDGLLDLPLEILLAANMIDIASAVAPGEWAEWLLTAFPKDGNREAFRRHRARALPLLDPTLQWDALAAQPGGERLRAAWWHRAEPLQRYGALLRDTGTDVAVPVGSLLHMHHNRLAGIDPRLEGDARAVARGVVQAHRGRERHMGR